MPARITSLLSFLLFLLGLSLLLAGSAWAYPRVAEPLFGLRQLREHVLSDDGRRMTMDFVHEDAEAGENGRRVEVSYDLEMAPGLRTHNTDEEEHLLEVHGPKAGQVCLVLASSTAAAAFDASVGEGDVIHGHYQEKPGEAAEILPYHARVLSKTIGDGGGKGSLSSTPQGPHVLLLAVDTPGLTELFINAKAKVAVRLAPQDYRILRNNASMAATRPASASSTEYGQGDPKELEEEMEEGRLVGLGEGKDVGLGEDKEGRDESTILHRRRRHQRHQRHQRQERQRGLTLVRRELRKSDFLQKGLGFIKNMFKTVQRLLNGAVDVLEVTTTGDIGSYSRTDTVEAFGLNYDESNREGVCSFKVEEALELPSNIMPFSGECRDCYAYSHLQLRFEIDVRNYQVNRLVTMIEGNIDFSIALNELKVASKGYVGERVSTFMALVGPAVPIPLGPMVSLTVETTVPVELGVELDTASTATFAVDIASRAFIKAGMHWSNGNLKALMGGPNLGMRAYAQGVGTRNGTSIDTMKDCGVEGTLGLNMSFAIGNNDLLAGAGRKAPEGIYSRIFPMGTDTVPNRSLRRVAADAADAADEPANIQSASIHTDDDGHGGRGRGLAPVGFDDWAKVGLTYQGTLQRLKNYCDDDDGSEMFIPSFLQVSAVVLGVDLKPSNGGFLYLTMALSYGKDTVSEQVGEGGAFAALNQHIYAFSIYDTSSSCTSVNTLFTPLKNPDITFPGVSYTASTTNESVVLPRLSGGVCDSSTKIILKAPDGCFRVDLDRVNRGGDSIEASSSSAVRRELGHDQRFGRVLAEVCSATSERAKPSGIALLSAFAAATTKGPSSAPTRTPSLRPTTLPSLSPTIRPTVRPSTSPSLTPSGPPSRLPSTRPSVPPSARPSLWPTHEPSFSPSLPPSTLPSRAPSTRPSSFPSLSPSARPSPWPTQEPSASPSLAPVADPNQWPSRQASASPSSLYSTRPSPWPTQELSASPSLSPSAVPSRAPSTQPSASPSSSPSARSSPWPTPEPSASPLSAVADPNQWPSSQSLASPSLSPSARPSPWPTREPSPAPFSPLSIMPTVLIADEMHSLNKKTAMIVSLEPTSASASSSDPVVVKVPAGANPAGGVTLEPLATLAPAEGIPTPDDTPSSTESDAFDTTTIGSVGNTVAKAPVTTPSTGLDFNNAHYPTEGPADVTVTSGELAVNRGGDIGSSVPGTILTGGLAGPESAAKANPSVPEDPPRTSPPTTAPARSHKDSIFDNDDPKFYFYGDEKEAANYTLVDEKRGTDDIFPNMNPNDESHSGQARGTTPPALQTVILWVTTVVLAICMVSGV